MFKQLLGPKLFAKGMKVIMFVLCAGCCYFMLPMILSNVFSSFLTAGDGLLASRVRPPPPDPFLGPPPRAPPPRASPSPGVRLACLPVPRATRRAEPHAHGIRSCAQLPPYTGTRSY